MSDETKTKRKGGRPRTGHLEFRGKTWWAQLTVDVDGESVREWVNLHTASKPAARVKVKRILAEQAAGKPLPPGDLAEQAKRSESFADAVKRCNEARKADGVKSVKDELQRLTAYAIPDLGELDVDRIDAGLVNTVLDGCKEKGKSRQTVQHVKQDIANVFAMLKREGVVKVNPCDEAELPKFKKTTKKVRSVLTDEELVRYLAWMHPEEHWQEAALERQVMACVARMFGGLRTGDLHALDWTALDTTDGRFAAGWAPRRKTQTPQALAIPEMLRPILRDWWERQGKPTSGPVFPVRRGDRAAIEKDGKREREPGHKLKMSHAHAFRNDLRRAFGLDVRRAKVVKRSNGRKLTRYVWEPSREPTARERELFVETAHTLPVDFHSWRRAFTQALADADVNAQTAAALAGHASLEVHNRYLANTSKMRAIPEAALPRIGVFHHFSGETPGHEGPGANENSGNSQSGWQDLNLQQPAPKAGPLPG